MFTAPIDASGGIAPTPKGQPQKAPTASEQVTPPVVTLPENQSDTASLDQVAVSPKAVAEQEQSNQPVAEQQGPSSQEAMAERINQIVEETKNRSTSVAFQVDTEDGDVVLKVVNRQSGETIREIPPEEIRNMQDKLKELRGVLIQEVS